MKILKMTVKFDNDVDEFSLLGKIKSAIVSEKVKPENFYYRVRKAVEGVPNAE